LPQSTGKLLVLGAELRAPRKVGGTGLSGLRLLINCWRTLWVQLVKLILTGGKGRYTVVRLILGKC
jgi:hypothetical protein